MGRRHSSEVAEEREEDAAKKREKQKKIELAISKLLTIPEFRLYMSHVLARGGMFQTAMTGNSGTYYQLGKQDNTKEIWAELAGVDIDQAFELLKPTFGDSDG